MATISQRYSTVDDLPANAPVFPLEQTILLPGRELPLNIFEPRYHAMVDASLAGDRMIGIIQPLRDATVQNPKLEGIGGLGRITAFSERPDGRYIICLTGLCRFRITGEMDVSTEYRQCRLDYTGFSTDLTNTNDAESIDRSRLLEVFASLLDASEMDADWEEITRSGNDTLVNTLAMTGPFGSREKQTMLEAGDLATRAEYLIAFTEITLAQKGGVLRGGVRTH